jgi:hypothetical protein
MKNNDQELNLGVLYWRWDVKAVNTKDYKEELLESQKPKKGAFVLHGKKAGDS